MIEKVKVKGFRCFKDVIFNFSDGINLIVGENDSGKSTLLDVFLLFKGDLEVDEDDFFNHSNMPIEISVHLNGDVYKYKNEGGDEKFYSQHNLISLEKGVNNNEFNKDQLGDYIKLFGGDLRGMNKISQRKSRLLNYIDESEGDEGDIERDSVYISKIFSFINFEDGKSFSNIQKHFKNFIKPEVANIWGEEIVLKSGERISIEGVISNKLDEIKSDREEEYSRDLLESLQEIIPNAEALTVTINPNLRDFSAFDAKIGLLESGGDPIKIEKKGDGTKRRITIAMFKSKSLSENSSDRMLYLFDEPDNHLNLRVQSDLINIFESLASNGHQIIFTSHSPFILNMVNLSNTILVENDGSESFEISYNSPDSREFEKVLYQLGIKNINIFFSRYFVFVEGKSEEDFLRTAYYEKYGERLEKKFIKVVNADSISNQKLFLQNFENLLGNASDIICIVDNDYQDNRRTYKFFESYQDNCLKFFSLGDKEFEDEFLVKDYMTVFADEIEEYSIPEAEILQQRQNSKKFSAYLSERLKLSKPDIARRLAEGLIFSDLSDNLRKVLTFINQLGT